MENYIVSARKYRPSTFESVVGQAAITQTLRNAIRQNHLAHAYLFCGPRGVGKTTCARIFAKTINCLNPTPDHDACNECESCRSFNEQRSFNIHELDAASHNGVEDMKDLIKEVRIPPQIGKYSVFIIDEVHMLSKDAFNAFLKTLEEPPSYAIFILATTEKHKVLPTILSRCQVFDFSRITINDTIRHLQYVAQKEGIEVTEEALNVVAQKADGGMRDALSIFDQLVSFCGNNISYEQAIDVLNVLDTEYYFRIVSCALESDVAQALLIFNTVLNKGFDAQNFIAGLSQHLRDLLVSKDPITTQLLETSDNIRKHYAEQAAKTDPQFLFRALDICQQADSNYRTARNRRLTVELMLIRLCQLLVQPMQAPATENKPLLSIRTAAQDNSAAAPSTNNTPQQGNADPAILRTKATGTTVAPQQMPAQPSKLPSTSAVLPKMPSLSIKSAMKGGGAMPQSTTARQTDQQPSASAQPTQNNRFTDQQFEQVWFNLPRQLGKEERLKASLVNSGAHVDWQDDKPTIVLTLQNSFQEADLQKHKSTITNFLTQQLHNDFITFSIQIEKMQKEAFTDVERYQNLIKRNPQLEELRKALNLDFE